jgi:hypothetical protein
VGINFTAGGKVEGDAMAVSEGMEAAGETPKLSAVPL